MFKRTNGYILLTLLVLTGLAGRVTTETLHSKERRLLITSLKDTRTALLHTVSGLSERQLNYKPNAATPSIRECLNHLARVEASVAAQADAALKQPAVPAGASKITDEEMVREMGSECLVTDTKAKGTRSKVSAEEALSHFKESRQKAIKYIRTTTENVRAYTSPTPAGRADVYQLYLGLCAHLEQHNRQIRELMASPGFPKQ